MGRRRTTLPDFALELCFAAQVLVRNGKECSAIRTVA